MTVKRTLGFGPVLLAAVKGLLRDIVTPTKEQTARAAEQAVRAHFGKRQPRRDSDVTDPYFGIKSKGRTGASERAALMAEAAPKRAAPKLSNPFKHDARRKAFTAALAAGALRVDAMKAARRVSVPTS